MKILKTLSPVALISVLSFTLYSVSSPTAVADKTINPTDDSYIMGGTNGETNYGSEQNLIIRNNPNISGSRKTYLKFDVKGLKGIQKAVVRLSVKFGTGLSITAYKTTDSWKESEINWNNAPEAGASLGTVAIAGRVYHEWDVTDYVKSEATGDGMVSLIFQDDSKANIQLGFGSKEFEAGKPELVISSN